MVKRLVDEGDELRHRVRLGHEVVGLDVEFVDVGFADGAAQENGAEGGMIFFAFLDEFEAVHAAHDVIGDEKGGPFAVVADFAEDVFGIEKGASAIACFGQKRFRKLSEQRFVIDDKNEFFRTIASGVHLGLEPNILRNPDGLKRKFQYADFK